MQIDSRNKNTHVHSNTCTDPRAKTQAFTNLKKLHEVYTYTHTHTHSGSHEVYTYTHTRIAEVILLLYQYVLDVLGSPCDAGQTCHEDVLASLETGLPQTRVLHILQQGVAVPKEGGIAMSLQRY